MNVSVFEGRGTDRRVRTIESSVNGADAHGQTYSDRGRRVALHPRVPRAPNWPMSSNESLSSGQPAGIDGLVLGGGYIAVEFASIFSRFGVDVTLAYRGDMPCSGGLIEDSQGIS